MGVSSYVHRVLSHCPSLMPVESQRSSISLAAGSPERRFQHDDQWAVCTLHSAVSAVCWRAGLRLGTRPGSKDGYADGMFRDASTRSAGSLVPLSKSSVFQRVHTKRVPPADDHLNRLLAFPGTGCWSCLVLPVQDAALPIRLASSRSACLPSGLKLVPTPSICRWA